MKANYVAFMVLVVMVLVVCPSVMDAGVVRIWRDCGALSVPDLRATVPDLIDGFRAVSKSIEGVELLCYSGDERISTQPIEKFIWGTEPVSQFVPPNPNDPGLPLNVRLYKQAFAKYVRDLESQFQRDRAAKLLEYQTRLESGLGRLKSKLLAAPKPASCIQMIDLMDRIADENLPLNILLTHGCDGPACVGAAKHARPITGRLLVGLYPRSGDSASTRERPVFDVRRKELLAWFPSAKVVHPYALAREMEALIAPESHETEQNDTAVVTRADRSDYREQRTRTAGGNASDWVRIEGQLGASSTYSSGWLQLAASTNFHSGEKLRLSIGGSSTAILVRLLPSGSDPQDEIGVLGEYRVPSDRTLEIAVTQDFKGIQQISVHGGPNPWGHWPLGGGNGPAAIRKVERWFGANQRTD